jgi:hypothetical protein
MLSKHIKRGPLNMQHPLIRILSHLLFWAAYLLYYLLQSTYRVAEPDIGPMLTQLSITMWVDMLAAYFTAYVLLQYFLFRRRYLAFTLVFLAFSFGLLVLQRTIMYYYIIPTYGSVPETEGFWEFNFLAHLLNIYVPVGVFLSVKLLKFWYRDQRIRQELVKQNIKSELALLRSQVNPHFLFNTLNNIDTLVKVDQKRASDSIMKLSELMRYMIYNSTSPLVALKQEIIYLESYIDLQRLRLANPKAANFSVTGSTNGHSIAPMLLIPFVENAFKHGSKNKDPGNVDIRMDLEGNSLQFQVQNSMDPHEHQQKDATRGIGLDNVRRRLKLLYPERYDLDIKRGNTHFLVTLKLSLDEN